MVESSGKMQEESSGTKLRRKLAQIIDEIGSPAPLDLVERRASCACAPFLGWSTQGEGADGVIEQLIKDGFLLLDHVGRTLSYRKELIAA